MTRPTKAEIMDDAADDREAILSSDLAAARRVLRLEADALRSMSDSLDATFTQALEILFAVTGRVVVTGMGKSGHIARKISATLASIGTPSHYVHPAEASHGCPRPARFRTSIASVSRSMEETIPGPSSVELCGS